MARLVAGFVLIVFSSFIMAGCGSGDCVRTTRGVYINVDFALKQLHQQSAPQTVSDESTCANLQMSGSNVRVCEFVDDSARKSFAKAADTASEHVALLPPLVAVRSKDQSLVEHAANEIMANVDQQTTCD